MWVNIVCGATKQPALRMRSLNKVMILGNVGADPESRFTSSNAPITRFNVATTRSWNDRATQERREETTWHRAVCFGRLAEIASEYLKKGSQCYIEGELRTNSWERDGVRQTSTEINVRELILLGGPSGQRGSGDYGGSRPRGGGDRQSRGGGDSYGSRNDRYDRSSSRDHSQNRQSRSDSSENFDDLDDDVPF